MPAPGYAFFKPVQSFVLKLIMNRQCKSFECQYLFQLHSDIKCHPRKREQMLTLFAIIDRMTGN